MTALYHLKTAREHLAMAMGEAEIQRRAAVATHPGGYHNSHEDDARLLFEIAQEVHGRLDRKINSIAH